MLTVSDAKAVVDTVRNDPKCRRRIESWLSTVLPDSIGLAGGLRNVGLMIRDWDAEKPETVAKVCVGIAAQTADAINSAAKSNPSLRRIAQANDTDRTFGGTYHVATRVQMIDGSAYVFDWHATLNVDNPLIYPSTLDFRNSAGAVTFEAFHGFGLKS